MVKLNHGENVGEADSKESAPFGKSVFWEICLGAKHQGTTSWDDSLLGG